MDAAAAARQAARDDDVDALRAAIAAGADPNASIHSHQKIIPLLALAAGKGHLGICELLVASGADLNAFAHHAGVCSVPVLFGAIGGRSRYPDGDQLACVRLLLDAGADPNALSTHHSEAEPNLIENTSCALIHAVLQSNDGTEMVQLLIDKGAMTEPENGFGTALLNALGLGKRKTALMLLRAGAAMKVLHRRDITDTNEALHDFLADVISKGGWERHVQRHRDRLLGVISHCVRLPHDVKVTILDFWSPPGGS
jgi:hypothetical protein